MSKWIRLLQIREAFSIKLFSIKLTYAIYTKLIWIGYRKFICKKIIKKREEETGQTNFHKYLNKLCKLFKLLAEHTPKMLLQTQLRCWSLFYKSPSKVSLDCRYNTHFRSKNPNFGRLLKFTKILNNFWLNQCIKFFSNNL